MKIIIWLEDVSRKDVSVAGGKGAQLGELKKAGFPVPYGFAVATSVYKAVMKNKALSNKVRHILANLDTENSKELEEKSNYLQSLIASAELPEKTMKEILEAYRKLGGLAAVRSSATSEDMKDASFAGQLATFLNVSEVRLLESVRKCMASLFTARAIYYSRQKHSHTRIAIAVVVQKMVDSKKAGVAFSVNPVTNNEKEMVIEAASGLGEAVVGGRITPDNYLIEKETNKLKESRVAKEPVLNGHELTRLAETVKKIEKHYSFPQDVEWAIDHNNNLFILQSRPVTTMKAARKPSWKKIISREYAVQYTELSLKCLSPASKKIVPFTFYEQIYVPEDGNEACYIDESRWNEFVSSLKKKYLETPENYEEFEKLFMKAGNGYMETARKIAKTSLRARSNAELKKMYLGYLKKNLTYGPFIWMQFIINNFFAEKAKEIISGRLGRNNKNLFDFIEAVLKPDKKAASAQLNEIASRWDSMDEDEKTSTWEKFRWIPCLDIHNKPWTKEEFFSHVSDFRKTEKRPPVAYGVLIKKLRPSKEERQILGTAKRLAYLKDLKDDFRRQGIFYTQKLFEEIAGRMGISVHDISYLLEEEVMEFLGSGKKIPVPEIERRKRGFVIYFNPGKKICCSSGKDVESAMHELGLVIAQRDRGSLACQKVFGEVKLLRDSEDVRLPDTMLSAHFEKFSEEIKGVPASPGRAKGFVRIVRGVSDLGKVTKGDILVAVTTHPDYVPAMQKASAIVTDEGGITSHAAIVARELGLPCVVGTKHATKSLRDGDEVEIDADAGLVRKIKR